MISCSLDNTIKLWKEDRVIREDRPTTIYIFDDQLVSGNDKGEIKFRKWDEVSNRYDIKILNIFKNPIKSILNYNENLAIADNTGIISIKKGKKLKIFKAHKSRLIKLISYKKLLISVGDTDEIAFWSGNVLINKLNIGKAIFCVEIINDLLIIGTEEGIEYMDFNTFKIIKKISLGRVISILPIEKYILISYIKNNIHILELFSDDTKIKTIEIKDKVDKMISKDKNTILFPINENIFEWDLSKNKAINTYKYHTNDIIDLIK